MERARTGSSVAIRLLVGLDWIFPISEVASSQAVIVSLAAFTDERDPWVTLSSFQTAILLLKKYVEDTRQSDGSLGLLIRAILEQKIRPLFARTKNPAITSQGRRSIRLVHGGYDPSAQDPETKPWKFRHIYIVSVFRWVLQNIDVRTSSTRRSLGR